MLNAKYGTQSVPHIATPCYLLLTNNVSVDTVMFEAQNNASLCPVRYYSA
jgi:hypothetical protein